MKYPSKYIAFVLILLALLGLSLTVAAQEDETENPLSPPTGPYQVGITMRQFQDEEQDKLVTVWFWYPAEVEEDAEPAPYLFDDVSREKISITLGDLGWKDTELAMQELDELSLEAYLGAPIAVNDSPYPVVVYSNGLGYPLNQGQQTRDLASHGYIVADVNHWYQESFRLPSAGSALPFANDIIFVLDQLEVLGEDDALSGHLDLDHIGVSGWSASGGAVYQAGLNDDRIKAGVSEDGTPISSPDNIPWLFMNIDFNPGRAYTKTEQSAYLMQIEGFTHMSLGDVALWPGAAETGRFFRGEMTGVRATEIINAYLVAFFDEYLKGIEQPLLDGSSDDFPEVTIESRNTEG